MENSPSAPEQAPQADAPEGSSPNRHRPVWGLPVVVIAVVVIAVLFVVGFTGLFANPVQSVNANGTTTLSGTFEPYLCTRTSATGTSPPVPAASSWSSRTAARRPTRGATITVDGQVRAGPRQRLVPGDRLLLNRYSQRNRHAARAKQPTAQASGTATSMSGSPVPELRIWWSASET